MELEGQDIDSIPFPKKTDKARKPTQDRGIKTKRRIIDAGIELFSQKGYHRTNSKEIAALAGVATGCFYSYFEDKHALFLEVLRVYGEECSQKLDNALLEMGNIKNRKEFLLRVMDSLLSMHDIFTGIHNEIIVMRNSDEEVLKIVEGKRRKSIDRILEYFKMWESEIRIKDMEAAAHILFNGVNNIVDMIVFSKSEVDKQRLINETVDMLERYVFE